MPCAAGAEADRGSVVEPGLLIGQVVKQYARRRVVSVVHRVVRGTTAAITEVLTKTATGNVINTAYIERLNATFRAALAPLARRGRALAHLDTTLTADMYLVGCAYNFCWYHCRLQQEVPTDESRRRQARTPAMAALLTDHRWTMTELLRYQVPWPPWIPPKRDGRTPKQAQPPLLANTAA